MGFRKYYSMEHPKRILVQFPGDALIKIKKVAAARGKRVSAYIRDLILADCRLPKPKQKVRRIFFKGESDE
jgi:predicted DNA binding CopG/RHH family protein